MMEPRNDDLQDVLSRLGLPDDLSEEALNGPAPDADAIARIKKRTLDVAGVQAPERTSTVPSPAAKEGPSPVIPLHRESLRSKSQPSGWRRVGRWLEVGVACAALTGLIVLAAFRALNHAPAPAGGDGALSVTDGQGTQTQGTYPITEQRALEIARAVDPDAQWSARFELNYALPGVQGEVKPMDVWVLLGAKPRDGLSLVVDARTGSIIMTGATSVAPPPQGPVPLPNGPGPQVDPKPTEPPQGSGENPNPDTQQAVMAKAREIILALKGSDMMRLSRFVHPDKGIRLSPYGFIRTGADGDRVYTGLQLRTAMSDGTKSVWGMHDGSGMPIELTFADYYHTFIYNQDFASAPQVVYNKVVGSGNTRINIAEAYPGAVFVEYHFPGTEANSGMDWNSLRLIFQQKGDTWYLVGISHDQWTI